MNSCMSGGYWARGVYETNIPNAFGNYGALESGETYVGWFSYYWPESSDWSIYGVRVPFIDGLYGCGSLWTEDFWSQLAEGYTAGQATGYADNWYGGYQAEYLYLYGGADATWLYR